jgi:hypothetical protein
MVAEPHPSRPALKLLHFGILSRVQGLLLCFGCLERQKSEDSPALKKLMTESRNYPQLTVQAPYFLC